MSSDDVGRLQRDRRASTSRRAVSTLVTLASINGAFSRWRNIPGTGAAI
jgi:hypothetical protein